MKTEIDDIVEQLREGCTSDRSARLCTATRLLAASLLERLQQDQLKLVEKIPATLSSE